MVEWAHKVGRDNEPQLPGAMLADIMTREVSDVDTRVKTEEYYKATHMMAEVSGMSTPAMLDKAMAKDADERDPENEEILRQMMELMLGSMRVASGNELPAPDFPIGLQGVLDLAVSHYCSRQNYHENAIMTVEQKIEQLESQDTIGLSAAQMRDELHLSDTQLKTGDERAIANNLLLLQRAVQTLILQDMQAVDVPKNREERLKALSVVEKGPQIIGDAMQQLSETGDKDINPLSNQRNSGLHDALAELQAALQPVVEKAKGEMKNK